MSQRTICRSVALGVGSLSLTLLGCSGAEPEGPRFTVTDSAGVRIVVNHAPQWESGEEWTLSEEPFLALGTVDGGADQQFTNVLGATRMSDGRVAVLDRGSAELRIFGADGSLLLRTGGQGQGPGEFNGPRGLLRTDGDTLHVSAYGEWEVSSFTSSGEFIGIQRLDITERSEMLGQIWGCPFSSGQLLPDLTILACVDSVPLRYKHPEVGRPGHLLVRTPYDGTSADTLGSVYGMGSREALTSMALLAGGSTVAAGGSPLRIIVGDPAFFEIEVYGQESEHLTAIRYPDGLRAVEAAEGEAYLDELQDLRSSMGDAVTLPSGEVAIVSDAPTTFAPSFPGFTGLHYDSEGFIWADSYIAPWETGSSAIVFSVTGELLGSVVLPERFEIHEIGSDYILGVWRDELDVEFIRMYALRRN